MAITAQKFIHLLGIWLEGELSNLCPTLRALPITLEHLFLKSVAAIVIESHFLMLACRPFRLGTYENGFDTISGPFSILLNVARGYPTALILSTAYWSALSMIVFTCSIGYAPINRYFLPSRPITIE